MTRQSHEPTWLYNRNGKTFGPLSTEQLHRLVAERHIGPKDLVCRSGTDRWIAAGSLDGLFSGTSARSDTVETVVVQPREADLSGDAQREDARWRSFGAWFLVANVAACAIIGLIKPPPENVTAYMEMRKSLQNARREMEEASQRIRDGLRETQARVQSDVEQRKRVLENIERHKQKHR